MFNRRRNFLVWMHSNKFDYLFSEADKERMKEAEGMMFRSSCAMKAMSVFLATQLRFFRRPVGRSWLFDFTLIYLSTYCMLGSNIPGVLQTWPMYSDLTQRMLECDKLKKRGLRNTMDFMNQTSLPDHKCYFYLADMNFARYY